MSLPREILKWILSLDLSYTVKNARRDFANGFLFAEVLSRYYPADIQMHSFENVTSVERKRQNWALLMKLFKKKGIPMERAQIDAVIAAEGDAAVEALQTIYSFIQSPGYEATKNASARSDPERLEELSQPRDRGSEASTRDGEYSDSYQQQQQQQQQHLMMQQGYAGHMDGNGYSQVPAGAANRHGSGSKAQHGLPSAAPLFIPAAPEMSQALYMQQQQQQQQYYAMLAQQQQQQAAAYGMGMGMMGMQPMQPMMGGGLGQAQQAAAYGMGPGSSGSGSGVQSSVMSAGQRHVSPGMNRYASPWAQGGAGQQQQQQQQQRGGGPAALPSGPGQGRGQSSAQPSASSQGPGQGQGAGNARFKSPARAAGAGGYAAGGSPGYAAGGAPGYAAGAGGGAGSPGYAAGGGGAAGYAAGGSPGYAAGGGGSAGYAAGASPGYAAAAGGGYAAAPAGALVGGSAVSAYAQQAAYAAQQAAAAQLQQQQYAQQYAQLLESPSGSQAEEREGLSYSRKPRPVDFQPYDMKDFEDKEYNIKKAGKGYWELGRLGPDLETEELQAKREKQERVKQMAAQVREDNMKKQAASKPAVKPVKEPTARERALSFAKNVPKPEPKPEPKQEAPAPGKKGPGGSAAAAKQGYAVQLGAGGKGSVLEELEALHSRDQQKVDAIRAELSRMLN